MISAESFEETLRSIADEARAILGAHYATASFDPGQEGAVAPLSVSSSSERYAEYEAPIESERMLVVGETGRARRLSHAELAARLGPEGERRRPPFRGWLAAPLVDEGGREVGLLQLSDKEVGEFTDEDEALVDQLALFASMALRQARLRDERVDLLLREHIARTSAEEAVRARDVFVSVASHELKTPLTTLRLQTDLLSRTSNHAGPELRQRFDSGLVVLRRQLDRLEKLVGELLDVSRLSSGHLELHPEPLDFAQLLEEAVGRLEETAHAAKCSIELQVQGPLVGSWDKTRLDQVVTNLLSNALKYGAGKPVQIWLEASGDKAILRVRDQGIGIAVEAQGRLFRRFERLVSDRHYGGLGLGLWIVREIVEQFGGTIRVESDLGKGATFIVELPRTS